MVAAGYNNPPGAHCRYQNRGRTDEAGRPGNRSLGQEPRIFWCSTPIRSTTSTTQGARRACTCAASRHVGGAVDGMMKKGQRDRLTCQTGRMAATRITQNYPSPGPVNDRMEHRPGLFAAAAGTLSSFGMNILKAEAFPNRRGLLLDTFTFADPSRTLGSESHRNRPAADDHRTGDRRKSGCAATAAQPAEAGSTYPQRPDSGRSKLRRQGQRDRHPGGNHGRRPPRPALRSGFRGGT